MRTASRGTRRTSSAASQLSVDKENLANHNPPQDETTTANPTPSKKARHRVSTAELARLEDVFRRETHPSRQQKKDLAAELGMDYKNVTIWFQNKRQTAKRRQPHLHGVERLVKHLGRTRADSCLRSVSSPSQNATLELEDTFGSDLEADPTAEATESEARVQVQVHDQIRQGHQGPGLSEGLGAIASSLKAIVGIGPLFDSLNALTSRSREHSEGARVENEAPRTKDVDLDPHQPQTVSENPPVSTEGARHDQTMPEQEQTKGRPMSWKRMRTLEWACERQAKRRKLSRESLGFVRLGSEGPQDSDPNDARVDSALSLLSLASSPQIGPPNDVMKGASLLLSFKHSWRRK